MVDATDVVSIRELAERLWDTKHPSRLCSEIHRSGLMKVQPWTLRLSLFIHLIIRGNTLNFWCAYPQESWSFIDAVCQHMRYGYDAEDALSIGGFSQRELEELEYIVRNIVD